MDLDQRRSAPDVTDHFRRHPAHYLSRSHLVTSLSDLINSKQMVLLQAPAGYGKTFLVLECLQALPLPAVYLRVAAAPDVSGPSLYRVNPWATEAMRAAASIYAETKRIDLALQAIAAEATDAQTLVVIIDDYPSAEDDAHLPRLETLLSSLPSALHVVMSSRGQPDLPLARWSAEGRLALYTQNDLRLSMEETQQIVSAALGRPLQAAEADLLEQNLAGWALGIGLIVNNLARDAAHQHPPLLTEIGLIWSISEYLEHEVMQVGAVSPAEREFMEQTSVLPDLGIDICNSFMGLENSGEVLRNLERRGCYVSHLDDGATIYAYHPVFRRFLQKQLRERGGAAALKAACLRAARVFEEYRLWRRAIWYYLLAYEYEVAVRLIEEHGAELLERPATLSKIEYVRPQSVLDPASDVLERLSMLPPEMVEARTFLLIVQARALFLQGNYKLAKRTWNRVFELLAPELDALTEARGETLGADGEVSPVHAQALLQKMWPEDHRAGAVCAEALHSLSLGLGDFADTLQAVAVEEAALAVAREIPHAATRFRLETRILLRLARLYRYRADLPALRGVIDRLCRIGAGGIKDNEGFTWFCDEGHMLLDILSGDLKAAQELGLEWQRQLRQDPEHAEGSDRLNLLLGRLALLVGSYDEAEACFLDATFSTFDMIHLRLLQGHLEDALQLSRQALASFPAGNWSLKGHLALAWLGIVESRSGQLETGARRLETAVQMLRGQGMFIWLPGAELHLAWALTQLGQESRATMYVESALAAAANTSTTYFAFWHPDVMAFACTVAEANQIQTDYVRNKLRPHVTPAPAAVTGLHSQNGTSRQPARRYATAIPLKALVHQDLVVLKKHSALQLLIERGQLTAQGVTKLLDTYRLTPREAEVFVWYVSPDIRVGSQRVNQAIADRLFLSELTVRAHISAILKKLDLPGRDRLQLRSWAMREGVIPE